MGKCLLLLALCLGSLTFAENAEIAAASVTPKNQSIVLYYTKNCPYCHEVMDYLHSIHKKVPMVDLDGNGPGQDALRKVGGDVHVPCLVVNNKAMYGSEDAIKWLSQHKDELMPE